jgi:uncharacterized protein (DUF4213/DUF364 family)
MILDEICDLLLPSAAGRLAADIRIGLGYTAVLLDDGRCGLAYTLRDKIEPGCGVIAGAGTLAGRPAGDLAALARSADPLDAAAGLATLNALAGSPPEAVPADLLALLDCRPDETAGMVGHFAPLVDPLRARCRTLHVFERDPAPGSGLLPESAAPAILPQCQVVILSATTLLTRTLDSLLALCRGARTVAIAGPSTPMLPAFFAARGVTLLSGVKIACADRVLRVVSEGGGTRQFGSAVIKIALPLAPATVSAAAARSRSRGGARKRG